MASRSSFAYAQARLQAHHGRRPTKSTWQHLNSSKSLGHYLDSARQTGLKRWVMHLSATSSVHAIEESLRREWWTYVGMISAWSPREWRPALHWTGGLVDVPMTVHLARGLAVPEWAEGERQKTILSQKDDQDWLAQPAPMVTWLDHFRTLVPSRADGVVLEKLMAIFQRGHDAEKPVNTLEGIELRYQLISRLERLFRGHAQQPAAVFAFLAMVAMDLEHLRAHLVHRCLFPETLDNR